MINKKIFLLTLMAFISFTGCEDKKENDTKAWSERPRPNQAKDTFKTVDFYDINQKIRDARIEECKKMIETTETVAQDCKNAVVSLEAQKKVESRSVSIDWSSRPRPNKVKKD